MPVLTCSATSWSAGWPGSAPDMLAMGGTAASAGLPAPPCGSASAAPAPAAATPAAPGGPRASASLVAAACSGGSMQATRASAVVVANGDTKNTGGTGAGMILTQACSNTTDTHGAHACAHACMLATSRPATLRPAASAAAAAARPCSPSSRPWVPAMRASSAARWQDSCASVDATSARRAATASALGLCGCAAGDKWAVAGQQQEMSLRGVRQQGSVQESAAPHASVQEYTAAGVAHVSRSLALQLALALLLHQLLASQPVNLTLAGGGAQYAWPVHAHMFS